MKYFKNPKRTFKRELAIFLLAWLVYVVETKDANIIEILVWPIFTFSALAFGMDWFGKSGGLQQQPFEPTNRWGSERSSEHTVGPAEYSDDR